MQKDDNRRHVSLQREKREKNMYGDSKVTFYEAGMYHFVSSKTRRRSSVAGTALKLN